MDNVRWLIEYRDTEREKEQFLCTPNEAHAKKRAKEMTLDPRYRTVILHKIVIEQTWKPTPSVDFVENTEAPNKEATNDIKKIYSYGWIGYM